MPQTPGGVADPEAAAGGDALSFAFPHMSSGGGVPWPGEAAWTPQQAETENSLGPTRTRMHMRRRARAPESQQHPQVAESLAASQLEQAPMAPNGPLLTPPAPGVSSATIAAQSAPAPPQMVRQAEQDSGAALSGLVAMTSAAAGTGAGDLPFFPLALVALPMSQGAMGASFAQAGSLQQSAAGAVSRTLFAMASARDSFVSDGGRAALAQQPEMQHEQHQQEQLQLQLQPQLQPQPQPQPQAQQTPPTIARVVTVVCGEEVKPARRRRTCPTCHKSLSSQTNLATHMRIHTNERPFRCSVPNCDKGFNQLSNLRRHERTHLGERNFECEVCKTQLTRKNGLKRHLERQHGIVATGGESPRAQRTQQVSLLKMQPLI